MTVKQRRSWIGGGKINFGGRVPRHAERVLHQARHRPVADLSYLESVPVGMHGMNVPAVVVHEERRTFARREDGVAGTEAADAEVLKWPRSPFRVIIVSQ